MTEHKGIELPLSSGFTVLVKPLPPYYLDFIDDEIPLLKFPVRKLKLVSGDTVDLEYMPPDAVPPENNVEEYELYVKYMVIHKKNAELQKLRDRARSDFLLSNCVSIVSGPVDYEDTAWVVKLEASFKDYKVPSHAGKRMLAFLKSNVITSTTEKETIVSTACFQEVNLQGIIDALRGFQSSMEQQASL